MEGWKGVQDVENPLGTAGYLPMNVDKSAVLWET